MSDRGAVTVLGASGTVGSALAEQLAQARVPVRAVYRPDPASPAVFPDGVVEFPGDFSDAGLLQRAMTGSDALFMLTPPDPSQPEWHAHIVSAAQSAGVRRIVKLSAFDSGPTSSLQMGRWHHDGEQAIRQAGIDHVILRPQYFMQNLTKPLKTAVSNGVLRGPSAGTLRMGFVDARDIAAVAVNVLTTSAHSGATIVPTGPDALSFDEIAELVGNAAGSHIRYEQIPEAELRVTPPLNQWPSWHVEDYLAIHGTAASELVTTDVSDVTGRPPRSLRTFVTETITSV